MYINRIAENILLDKLNSKKICIILGARQTGKTTLIKHLLADKNSAYFNLDIDVDKQRLLSASSLEPEKAIRSLGGKKYIVIDEAQRLPEIGKITKGWYDSGVDSKIILLGSSSLDLLNKSAESLAGRNEKIYLPPLTFQEIIEDQDWYSPDFTREAMQSHFSSQIAEILIQSIVFGNYPETVATVGKREYLINLISDYIFKDALQFGLIKMTEPINKLLSMIARQIGSEISVNELAGSLGMARQTVERYLDLLEQTFIIFSLPAFSTNPRKEITKSKKIYFWDTGVRNALLNDFSINTARSDIGALWENWVVSEFAKFNMFHGKSYNLYFWRSKAGAEIDLVVQQDDKINAFEVKWKKGKSPTKVFTQDYGVEIDIVTSSQPLINFVWHLRGEQK
jgi:uncharacterized protein